jgi:hypothetical protein
VLHETPFMPPHHVSGMRIVSKIATASLVDERTALRNLNGSSFV